MWKFVKLSPHMCHVQPQAFSLSNSSCPILPVLLVQEVDIYAVFINSLMGIQNPARVSTTHFRTVEDCLVEVGFLYEITEAKCWTGLD